MPRTSERVASDKALWAVDPLTGLLVAAALIHPEKKLNAIDVGFVMNRFKESSLREARTETDEVLF